MASGKKKQETTNTARKPGRPRKNETPAPAVEPQDSFIRAEVLIIVSFAAAVLLFLSNFHLCGVAGDFLRSVQLGIFGFMGFAAPLLLFVGTAFYMSNRGNPAAIRKLLASILAGLVLCSFAQLFFGGQPGEGEGLMAYYKLSSANGAGGGLIGGLICRGLVSVLGTVGTFLVLAVLFVISAVCITERSIVKVVKKHSDTMYQYAREDIGRRREIHAEKQEERRRLRQEQRVRGVNISSTDLSAGKVEAPLSSEQNGGGPEEAGKQQTEQAPFSAADVFTGKISMPPEYSDDQEDGVPFDENEAVQKTMTAQQLVEEGISRLDNADELFLDSDRLRMEEDLLHIREIPVESEVPWDVDEKDTPSEPYRPETLKVSEKENSPYEENSSYKENSSYEKAFGAASSEADSLEDSIHIIMADPADSISVLEKPSESDDGSIQERPSGSESTDFFIPEESKRVVTASGKVIESDTEALQKKLERKRSEAKEANEEASVKQQIEAKEEAPKKKYVFPPLSLLKRGSRIAGSHSEREYKETAVKLQQTLRDFGVGVTVTNISCGPSVTRYELHPEQGVKVSKIVGLADDIKLSLAAAEIRIEAPIPGKSAVGIEVPNKENSTVYLRDLLESDNFRKHGSRLAFAVGKDIGGQVVVTDIAKMPHLLIAGATGSGKSVCINTLIMSIIFKSDPEDVKMIMVDPKVVELSVYNGIPHLLIPVVTDPKKASGALNWAVAEMTDRYKKFAEYGVRDLKGYNAKIEQIKDIEDDKKPKKMPQIVIIVDELADLMMVAPGEVEDAICRLAQLARAAGIHLVIATQRPSVNVITGLIKANVPSRIAFSVSSGVDSRTIIDMNGAEKLLGKGDMLFYPAGYPKPQRVQGAFVSDQEVQAVVDFLTEQGMSADYSADIEKQMSAAPAATGGGAKNGRDEYFGQAGAFIIEKDKASIGMLQRMFKIGFNRAARIMDQLAEAGVVGPEEGTKPRKIMMTMEEFEELLNHSE